MMNSTFLDPSASAAVASLSGAVTPAVAGAAAPRFAQAMDDAKVGKEPTIRDADDPVKRQVAAAPGNDVPDCGMPDPDDAPPAAGAEGEAADKADDRADRMEPAIESALAWLLPPPLVPTPSFPLAQAPTLSPDCEMPADPVALVPTAANLALAPEAGDETAIPDQVMRALKAAVSGAGTESVAKHALTDVTANKDPAGAAAPELATEVPSPALIMTARRFAQVTNTPSVAITLEPAARNAPTAAESLALAANGSIANTNATLPVATSQQLGMDLTRDPGLHRMIDRIEHLRDSFDTRETRIRLIPDALGPVDIAVRRAGTGDAVQIHFTAAEAVTRQLIADAQHRLVELADSRGVRIDRSTVDSGSGQAWGDDGQSRAQQQPRTSQPIAPASAGRDAEPESQDKRIA